MDSPFSLGAPMCPDYFTQNGRVYRIVADHLGSPRLVIDAADGTVAERIDYGPWGQVTRHDITGPAGYVPIPFTFAGGIGDIDTGLVRFGARDYDPMTGRWTVKDPIRFNGGDTNLYGYVVGDPVNRNDPRGLWTITLGGGAVGGAGGLGTSSSSAIALDGHGNIAILATAGAGTVVGTGPGLIAGESGLQLGGSNLDNVFQLEGGGLSQGGGGPFLSGEVNLYEKGVGWTGSVSLSNPHGYALFDYTHIYYATTWSEVAADWVGLLLGAWLDYVLGCP